MVFDLGFAQKTLSFLRMAQSIRLRRYSKEAFLSGHGIFVTRLI